MTTATVPHRPERTSRRMNSWRLEWLRLRRSARGVALVGVFAGYGILGPILARYMADLVRHLGSDSSISITVRPPVPKDGIITYVNQVSQIGLVVAVVVAAGALAIDSRRGVSTFFRTRATSMWQLMIPRYVVPALAAITAYSIGTLVAWYETTLLIGPVPVRPLFGGVLCQAVFLTFAVAVVGFAASVGRTTLSTIGIALAVVLLLPLLSTIGTLHDWLPTTLANAPVDLLNKASIGDYAPALGVTAVLTPVVAAWAVVRLHHRDA